MSVWPYSYSWVNDAYKYSVNSLTNAYNMGGITNAIFAFVIADNTGNVASDIEYKFKDLIDFQALGGNLRLSFGGALGTMIDESIKDENKLYDEYNKIITKTQCYSFDFDIEGDNVYKNEAHARRNKVLLRLQKKYPKMYISYTLAADTNGLSDDNLSILKNSITYGVNINMVNVMLMDNGWTDSAQSAIKSIQTLQSQLKVLWPNKLASEINKMIGACFMIGKNDDSSFFSLDNANTVVNYFNSIGGIGQISYWALQRDTTGSGDYNMNSLYNKNDFDFYKIFSKMKSNSTLPTSNTPVTPVDNSNTQVKVGTNIIINNVKYTVEQDPKINWMKINGITLGESYNYGYKTIVSDDIGKLLDTLYNDKNVKLLNYNWNTKTAYLKTNYDITKSQDVTINKNYTVFIKK